MKRISIIGSGGSGKSTLAVRLGAKLQVPVYHLDALYWKPGWVETDKDEWAKLQQSICEKPSWIMDGNYGGTVNTRLNTSDTVIFLDINRYLCLYRAVKRTIAFRGRSRPDMGSGCNEKLDLKFIQWIYGYPKSRKPKVLEKLASLNDNMKVYVLKNERDIEHFFKEIEDAR